VGVISSYKTVDAVFSLLPALTLQFQQASNDTALTSKDRAKATAMAKKIQSFSFIAELALLKDVLTSLNTCRCIWNLAQPQLWMQKVVWTPVSKL